MKAASPESQYTYLHNNTESFIVSNGVDPTSKVERHSIKSERIPVDRIERSYVQNCDTLAGIFDGSIKESKHFFDGEARHPDKPITHAIYLDKSSRPVHVLMRLMWDKLSDGIYPHASYRNIDKHNWRQLMLPDTENADAPEVNAISLANAREFNKSADVSIDEHIARLRATYLSREDLEKVDENNIIEDAWKYPTILEGQRVAIVDEVKSSGATLKVADVLLQAAIPEAVFEPVYWSVPSLIRWTVYDSDGNSKGREFAASTVPVWYDQDTSLGRGIRDLDSQEALLSPSKKQRMGAYVMSRPYVGGLEMDKRSKDIRKDLYTLAQKFNEGEVGYIPSASRTKEDFEQRIEEYYGIPYTEWLKKRKRRPRR